MGSQARPPVKKPLTVQERKDRRLLEADPRFRRHPDLGRFSIPDLEDVGLIRHDLSGTSEAQRGTTTRVSTAKTLTAKALTDVILYSYAPDNKLDAVRGVLVVLRGTEVPPKGKKPTRQSERDAETVRESLSEILAPLMACICSDDGTGELPQPRSPSLPHGAEPPELPRPPASIDDATKATIVSLKNDACEVLSLLLKSESNQRRFRERGCLRMIPDAVRYNMGGKPRLHLAQTLCSLVGNPDNFDSFREGDYDVLQVLLSLADSSGSSSLSDVKLHTIRVAAQAVQELSNHSDWLKQWSRERETWTEMLAWLGSGEKHTLEAGVKTMINLTRHDGEYADLIVNTNMQGIRLRGHKVRHKYFGGELLLSYLTNENSDFEEIQVAETADETSRDLLGVLLTELSQYKSICETLLEFGVLPILLSNFQYPHKETNSQAGPPNVLVVDDSPSSRPVSRGAGLHSTTGMESSARSSPTMWSPRTVSSARTAPSRALTTFRPGTRWNARTLPPRYGLPMRLGGPPLMPPGPPRPGTAAARFAYQGHELVRPKRPTTMPTSEPNLRRATLEVARNLTSMCPERCVKDMLDGNYLPNILETLNSLDVRVRRHSAAVIFDLLTYNDGEFLELGEPHVLTVLKRATDPNGDPEVRFKMMKVSLSLLRKNEALLDRLGMSGDRSVERYVYNLTQCVEAQQPPKHAEEAWYHLMEIVMVSLNQSQLRECIVLMPSFTSPFERFKKNAYPEKLQSIARELVYKINSTNVAVNNAGRFWVNKAREKLSLSATEKSLDRERKLAMKKLVVTRFKFLASQGTVAEEFPDLNVRQCVV